MHIVAYDFDRLSKDDRIGQISIPLDTVDLGALTDEWMFLDAPDDINEQACKHIIKNLIFLIKKKINVYF